MKTTTEIAAEVRALAKWTREKAESFARSLAEEHGHNPSMWLINKRWGRLPTASDSLTWMTAPQITTSKPATSIPSKPPDRPPRRVRSPATQTTETEPMKITTHANTNGQTYYSTTDENGQTIYSFTADFEDIWTQEDQGAIEAGSTPAKY
jgi:hypothetical protein